MPHLLIHRGPSGPRFLVISELDHRLLRLGFLISGGCLTPRRPGRPVEWKKINLWKKISSARSHRTAQIGSQHIDGSGRSPNQYWYSRFCPGRAVPCMKKIRWVLSHVIMGFIAFGPPHHNPSLHLTIQQELIPSRSVNYVLQSAVQISQFRKRQALEKISSYDIRKADAAIAVVIVIARRKHVETHCTCGFNSLTRGTMYRSCVSTRKCGMIMTRADRSGAVLNTFNLDTVRTVRYIQYCTVPTITLPQGWEHQKLQVIPEAWSSESKCL